MSRKGRRAIARREQPEVAPDYVLTKPKKWSAGDRTLINPFGDGPGKRFKATIMKVGEKRAKVKFDEPAGKVDIVKVAHLYTLPRCPNGYCGNEASANNKLCEECLRAKRSDQRQQLNIREGKTANRFGQFAIKWTLDNVNFSFDMQDGDDHLHCYGWYRRTKIIKTDEVVHAIDIFAVRDGKDYSIDSIVYTTDPRNDVRSLNADICARVQRWMSTKLSNEAETIDMLRRKAEHPTLHINRIETIDYILIKLREFRDTAIRAGGRRLFEMRGNDSNPPVTITIDVSTQAMMLKGKVPTLEAGGVYDVVKGGERRRPAKVHADPENVAAILKQLKHTKDKREARKLRGLLRSMGHKGGARAATVEVPVKKGKK